MRAVWLWLREQGLRFPLQPAGYLRGDREITWVEPTYHAVHNVLTHPGLRRRLRLRPHPPASATSARTAHCARGRRKLRQGEWEVLITDHHRGFIDWDTYQANQARIGANTRPRAHQPGTGAVREGCALLQGLATCGTCGRKLAVYYDGPAKSTPGYYCTGTGQLVDGRGTRHLRVGGVGHRRRGRRGVPGRAAARPRCRPAWPPPSNSKTATTPRWPSGAARSSRPATTPARAERRYRAVDPDNRLVARGLETEWEHRAAAAGRRRGRTGPPRDRAPENPDRRTRKPAILALGDDLDAVWSAPTTTDKDRKQLLRTLLDEVTITVHRDHDRRPAPTWCCAGRAARSPN